MPGAILSGKHYVQGKWLGERARSTTYTTESELSTNAGPNAFQLQETMLKSDKL